MLAPGDRVGVAVTTYDQGNQPALNSLDTSNIIEDNVIDAIDQKIGAVQVGSLSTGASRDQLRIFNYPGADCIRDTYYLGAIADRSGRQFEADETNNTRSSSPLTVTAPNTHPVVDVGTDGH